MKCGYWNQRTAAKISGFKVAITNADRGLKAAPTVLIRICRSPPRGRSRYGAASTVATGMQEPASRAIKVWRRVDSCYWNAGARPAGDQGMAPRRQLLLECRSPPRGRFARPIIALKINPHSTSAHQSTPRENWQDVRRVDGRPHYRNGSLCSALLPMMGSAIHPPRNRYNFPQTLP